MKGLVHGFRMAWGLLTTLPMLGSYDFDARYVGWSVVSYPLVGLILGVIVYFLHSVLVGVLPELHLLVLLFAGYVWLSGAIHLDGLVDVLDALLARQPERVMEILKDPRIGGLGAVFLMLFLLLKLSAFVHLESLYLFLAVPFLSRWSVGIAILRFPPISSGGMGESFKRGFTEKHFSISTGLSAVAMIVWGSVLGEWWWGLALMGVAGMAAEMMGRRLTSGLGGLNGDAYGFVLEVNELLLLHLLLVFAL